MGWVQASPLLRDHGLPVLLWRWCIPVQYVTATLTLFNAGGNEYGQCLPRDKRDILAPVKCLEGIAVKQVAAGGMHSLALTETGEVRGADGIVSCACVFLLTVAQGFFPVLPAPASCPGPLSMQIPQFCLLACPTLWCRFGCGEANWESGRSRLRPL